MDAQFCWTCLTTAYGDGDLVEAAEQAESLLAWLDQGNSPPETAGDDIRNVARTSSEIGFLEIGIN